MVRRLRGFIDLEPVIFTPDTDAGVFVRLKSSASARQPLKAHVHHGRWILDAPTDLPEGKVIELLPAEGVLDGQLDKAERVALRRDLEASFDDEDAGRVLTAAESIAELRKIR